MNAGPSTITSIGNTTHWPENNFIEPGADLWVNIESEPVGAGASGEVIFSSDGGATWLSAALSHDGVANDKDR